ncbi:MAG: glycogen-binding domain-containing protein, partial [Meiothermus silvanus]|nr:glycogen-binding domain-containing protein [Allomeiothermus silvanus]
MRLLWALWLAVGWALAVASATPVTFKYTPPQGTEVRTVSLRGQMNNWGETPMRLENGVWTVTVEVQPGRVQYKFFINGQWPRDMCAGGNLAGPDGKIDPQAEGCMDDGNGGRNALRTVSGQAAQT